MQSEESNLQSSNSTGADVRIAEGDRLQTTQYLTEPFGEGRKKKKKRKEMEQWIWGERR